MASIPEDLIKDAPTFPEFLAWYAKDRARERAESEERQKKWQAESEKRQAEYEARQAEYEEQRKKRQAEYEARQAEYEEQRKKRQAEYEEQQKKGQAEYEKLRKESEEGRKALEAAMATMYKKLGDLGSSIGELVETLVAARLWEKFPEYGLLQAGRRIPVYNEKGEAKTEIDILLLNGEWAMVVEVKHEVKVADVERHVERMARILKYPPRLLPAGLKLLGAIAGGVVQPGAKDLAHRNGFFVLELAGESVIRVPEPPDFTPKEWRA
jgi:hypothetical protein